MASTIGEINPLRYRGYYYDSESGYYYVQTRYYDPEICRYINAAEGGDAVPQAKAPAKYAHANRFLFNANNPQTCSMVPITPDVSGTGSSQNSNSTSYVSTIVYKLTFIMAMIGFEEAFEITCNISGKKGCIAIKLGNSIDKESFSDYIYIFRDILGDYVFTAMAAFAAKKFYDDFPGIYNKALAGTDTTEHREFLFSDDCVAEEIKEHVIGYWYGTEKSKEMTSITKAMLAFSHGSKTTLIGHCEKIDIGEQDVVGAENLFKNVMPFHYYNGIRECYLYTNADPYRVDDHTREFKEPSLNWALNKISV